MFKRDSLAFGVTLGALIPLGVYLLLQSVETERAGLVVPRFDPASSLVLALAVNLLPFSILMKKPQFEQTGKGMLIATFAYAAIYIYLKFFLKA